MERKDFFKSIGLAGIAFAGFKVLQACGSDDDGTGTTGNNNGNGTSECTVAPTETAGPFPTINPGSLVASDITSGRTGIPLTITIGVKNTNNDCNALADAIVDIWHCDKDGNYSEYGGTGMQSTDYTSVHFLRGRQVTNANGAVAFTSIFPGWYTGRATHIHVHIYNASGKSLLITQIAFPEGTNSAVSQVNASTANGYTKGMSGYTYNSKDNVFSDDDEGVEIATLTGSIETGYALTHTINVSA